SWRSRMCWMMSRTGVDILLNSFRGLEPARSGSLRVTRCNGPGSRYRSRSVDLRTHTEAVRNLAQQPVDRIALRREEVAVGDVVQRDPQCGEATRTRPVELIEAVALGVGRIRGERVACRAHLLVVFDPGRAAPMHARHDVIREEAAQPQRPVAQVDPDYIMAR